MRFTLDDLCRPVDFHDRHAPKINFAQCKYDGLRLLIVRGEGERITCMTRSGKTDFWTMLRDHPILGPAIEAIPENTVLDCELWCRSAQATDVKTYVKARNVDLCITPFAMPVFEGEDWRLKPIAEVEAMISKIGFTPAMRIEFSNAEEMLEAARANAMEGWVLKQAHYAGWFKLKPVKSCDAVIMGCVEGRGKHEGRLGALRVGLLDEGKLREICSVGTGFSDAQRTDLWNRRHGILFKVVEVGYDSLAGQGALKFPRFMRIRDDKPLTECTMEQVR